MSIFISQRKLKKNIALGIIFLFLFCFFYFTKSFYTPTQVIIKTHANQGTVAKLYWDSGIGFNERESISFTPYEGKSFEDKLHEVKIIRLDDHNPQSQGSEVWLENIFFNTNEKYDLSKVVIPNITFVNDNNMVAFKNTKTSIAFKEKFQSLDIVFYAHQWAGKVEVVVDGNSQIIDLYSKGTAPQKVNISNGVSADSVERKFNLPQLKIKAIKLTYSNENNSIDSVLLNSNKNRFSLTQSPLKSATEYLFNRGNFYTTSFNSVLFITQIVTALLVVLLVSLIWDYMVKLNFRRFSDIFYFVFERRHLAFWVMFSVSFITYLLWLLGQWPGIMTVDSYHYTWREIKTLEFSNITPWIYNIYVLALTQFYDSPAIVPIFQVFIMSLLGSAFFYFILKNGAKKWIVYVSFLFFCFSIPVGIYNITLWKDIPFNLIMLFWAFLIFYLFYKKKYKNKMLTFSFGMIFLLSLSLILLCTLRYNGIIYLVFVPLSIILLKLLHKKNLYQFLATSLVLYLFLQLMNPLVISLDAKQNNVGSYFSKTYKVGPLAAIFSSKNYYDPANNKPLINKWMTEEELQKYYMPQSQADTVNYMVSKWMKLNKTEQDKLNMLYYKSSILNFDVFFADRAAMLLGTMGFSKNVFITTNELNNAESDKSFWRPIEAYKFTPEAKIGMLKPIQDFAIKASKSFKGDIPISPLIFNTFPAFIILLFVMLLYKWFPGSALYSIFFLYNLPFLFIILSTSEWRYLYFLLISCYFIFPLISLEKNANKNKV